VCQPVGSLVQLAVAQTAVTPAKGFRARVTIDLPFDELVNAPRAHRVCIVDQGNWFTTTAEHV
jgi:hypothetical protein